MIKKMFKNKFSNTVLKYTLCFGIVMFFMCFLFISNGMNMIWKFDGFSQHFITLNYFRRVLHSLITTHTLNTFIWNIGFGLDMFSNLSYYVFGDVFSYFSAIVPTSFLKYLYFILVPARLYFAGLSFIFYCNYKKQYGMKAVIGSIVYTFCGFAVVASVRHPYFISPMIIFPISMIGIEKLINENKKVLYIFSVFLMFFCSFYFGYMNALVIALYGILLCIEKYKKDYKKIIMELLKALGYAFVGLLMSSFILVPTISSFLNSTRTSLFSDISYDINYYRLLLNNLTNLTLDISNWSFITVSSIVFFAMPLIFKNRKKNYPLFLLMIILFLPLISSKCSYIISGMSYPSNRYIYMFMFVISYLSVSVLNEKVVFNIKSYLLMLVVYLVLMIICETGITAALISSIIVFVSIIILFLYKDKLVYKNKSYLMSSVSLVVIIGTMFQIYYILGAKYNNYLLEFIDNSSVENVYDTVEGNYDNFKQAIDYIKDKDQGFYKIGKNVNTSWNLGLYHDYNSINYYYSINSYLYDLLASDLENSERKTNMEMGEFNNRVKITTLLGNKYFISNKYLNIYGYDLIKTIGNTYIYENKNNTLFANSYNKCINTKDYEKLSALEKEDALLKYYVSDSCKNKNIKLDNIKIINYKANKNINNKINVLLPENNLVKLDLKDKVKGELYVKISNIKRKEFSSIEEANISLTNDIDKTYYINNHKFKNTKENFTINISTDSYSSSQEMVNPRTPYYLGEDDILLNLGYYDNYDGDITITTTGSGKYDIGNIEVYQVSMDGYEKSVNDLKKSNFILDKYQDNYLSGSVDIEKDGVLSFETLYNKGWNVLIDGKKTSTFNNRYFLATKVKKGRHKIELIYKTPYIKEGVVLSIIGFISYFVIIIISKKKKN